MARVTNEQIEAAKSVNLVEFLRQRGYQLEKKGKEFCLKDHDSLCINPDNNCWRWHSRNIGGGNAIDFLRTYEDLDFVSAVQALCGGNVQQTSNTVSHTRQASQEAIPVVRSPENKIKIELEKVDMEQLQKLLEWVEAKSNGINSKAAAHNLLAKINSQIEPVMAAVNDNVSTRNEEMNEKMNLPERNDTHKRAFAYLAKTRCIDAELISTLMKQGRIYESKDYHNCVFVTYDENKNPLYASMRGTLAEKAFKGDVLNSDKSRGFPITGNSDRLFVFEAPIDNLSYITMQIMGGNTEWQNDSYLSLGGVSDVALARYLKEHPNIKNIYFGLDNDKAGREAVNGDGVHEGYISKYASQGYEVSAISSAGKDWNEDLVNIVASLREQETPTREPVGELEM